MDANGTRFHLLQGEADWLRWRTQAGARAHASTEQVRFDPVRREITLWPLAFRFPASRSDRPVAMDDRRGTARDAFGNWYWIAADRASIRVRSSGSGSVSTFWPVDETVEPRAPGGFVPQAVPRTPSRTLQGLAVTEDHYLVAGTLSPGGLLVFDLHGVGAPRERRWPLPFSPWDLAARPGGGVMVLDREHRRLWALDRRFDVDAAGDGSAVATPGDDFAPADRRWPDTPPRRVPRRPLVAAQAGSLAALADPIAVDVLADGSVLVLERQGADGFAAVQRWRDGAPVGGPASTAALSLHIEAEAGDPPFRFAAHDFALGSREADDPGDWAARAYIVGPDGNQAHAFGVVLDGHTLRLAPLARFYPMRLFGGRALVGAEGVAWYDCGERFVRLVGQCRARHVEQGELWTPLLDGGEPGCVWHRLMLDATLPPGTAVEVWSRASDDWRQLAPAGELDPAEREAIGAPAGLDEVDDGVALLDWQREPDPVRRGDGTELPFVPNATAGHAGTFELLFQRARGRHAQVRLVLRGDGRVTPRLRALRAWYPRFSYLQRYLPAVYRDDEVSASFLDRFLANVEGLFTTIEDRIAAAQILFDVDSAPAEALDWLGRWLGLALDPAWDEARRRLLIRHATAFFAMRGTVRGLQAALRLALDDCVDERVFAAPGTHARDAAPVRVVERFRTRRTPPVLLGDIGTRVPGGPQLADPAARWQPSMGGGELSRRYAQALARPAGTAFPLGGTGEPAGWANFAAQQLGFVPASGAAERAAWQGWQQRTRGTVDWNEVPADAPAGEAMAAAWTAFVEAHASHERRRWHAFLARRYRSVGTLNAMWRTRWASFGEIAVPDRLPPDGDALADWFAFEGTVLAMHALAHRFTVMLPVPRRLRQDAAAQQRRLALARRVVELEKPAHTVAELRFYWAMFRVGEARLGDDTLIELGSRSPELMAPMVLGTGALAETYLAAPAGRDAPDRLQLGRDRVGRSSRLGGP